MHLVCGRWGARTTDLSTTGCSTPQAMLSEVCQLQGFESLIFKMQFEICNLEINCIQMPVEGEDKRQRPRRRICMHPASDSGSRDARGSG